MKKRVQNQTISCTGILTAAEWDEENNIINVKLSTFNEDEYLIKQNAKGKALLHFVQRHVQVSGQLEEDKQGMKSLRVKKYEILKKIPIT